ncbi:MAG: LysR family transcriptional regulator [Bacteroidales bacterium]|nr:LysR family transcriptional regulator [Bacteroidales bacterium]
MLTDFRLKVFCAVAKHLNFTRAAKELNISQPAVSQNIAELEQQVGDALVERGYNGVELTKKGEVLLQYAEKILHLYESLNLELVPTHTREAARIRIAACPIAVRFILPKAIKKFQALHPTAEVELLERDDGEIERSILDSEADLGVMESRPANLSTEPFAKLTLSESGDALAEIIFGFDPKSQNIDTIEKFILTAKTTL